MALRNVFMPERELHQLIRDMNPQLGGTYIFLTSPTPLDLVDPLMVFRENEGFTYITQAPANELPPPTGLWRLITLNIHSDLAAVGFLATITTALAQAGISCNVVSAYQHDHLFVPEARHREAMNILRHLQQRSERH